MDLSRIAIMVSLITILASLLTLCLSLYKECIITCYCGISIGCLFWVISNFQSKKDVNSMIYNIMTSRNKMLKIISSKFNKDIKRIDEDDVSFFEDDDKTRIKMTKNSLDNASMSAIATMFMLPTTEAKLKCCKPFYIEYNTQVKTITEEGLIAYKNVEKDYFNLPNEDVSIYLNGTYFCDFTMYCYNNMYKITLDLGFYIVVLIALCFMAKVIRFGVSMFKTPVETVQIQQNDKKGREITTTTHSYCGFARFVLLIFYFIIMLALCTGLIYILTSFPTSNGFKISDDAIITIKDESGQITFKGTYKEYLILKGRNEITTPIPTNTSDHDNIQNQTLSRRRRSTNDIYGDDVVQYLLDNPDVNMTCQYDIETYIMTGTIISDCIINNTETGIKYYGTNSRSKYGKIDNRCLNDASIKMARMGLLPCKKVCKNKMKVTNDKTIYKDGECDIIYAPNAKRAIELNTNKNPLAKPTYDYKYESNMKISFPKSKSSRRKRDVSGSSETSVDEKSTKYGVGTYVWEGFLTQFPNPSGAIFLVEDDRTDTTCLGKEASEDFRYSVCSHKRRQMISCEPNLWGDNINYGNSFSCREPSSTELAAMPNWRKTGLKLPYTLPSESLAGDMPLDEFKSTINYKTYSVSIDVKTLWSRKYQDNIQQTGGMKYFVYASVLKVREVSNTQASTFVKLWDQFLTDWNGWGSRSFDGTYYMNRRLVKTRGNAAEWLMTLEYIEEPTLNNMHQDESTMNFVLKSDIYDYDGTLLIGGGTSSTSYDYKCVLISGTTQYDCTYLVPIYYAVRIYGPAKVTFKHFNHPIDTVAFSNDACSSVNAIKVKGVCYFPDMDTSSTDVIAGGYPWTLWSMMYSYNMKSSGEAPSFYLQHPKIASGQYMSKVSDSANIGYFSAEGKCSNTYYDNGTLKCDGYNAINVRIVEYTSFHRPLVSSPTCTLNNRTVQCLLSDNANVQICEHDPYNLKDELNSRCVTTLTKNINIILNETQGFSIMTPTNAYQIQMGNYVCKDCLTTILNETYHRCAWCVVLLFSVAGIGYIALALHILMLILGYINFYRIGRILRCIGLSTLCTGLAKTPKCSFCSMYMYSEAEIAKHGMLCPLLKCPYCSCIGTNGDILGIAHDRIRNFKKHMLLHQCLRNNPYRGIIKIKRCSITMFTFFVLLLSSQFSNTTAVYFDQPNAMRSNKIGVNMTVPGEYTSCTANGCNIVKNYKVSIPLSDGTAVVFGMTKDNIRYSKKFTIENPNLETTCTYDYSASNMIIGPRRIVYACKGKNYCTYETEDQLMLEPLAGHTTSDYVPLDTNNPLKSYYCPKAIACRSPISNFLWLTAGCWTVDDGTAVGYEYYMPNVKEEMAHVFTCTVNGVNYRYCEGVDCTDVNGDTTDTEDNEVTFEHIKNNLPVQFRVAATATVGNVKASHLFYNPPAISEETSSGSFSYRLNKIPGGDTCIEGTSYTGSTCTINDDGSSPAINCESKIPVVNANEVGKKLESLSDVYHCNFESTTLSWETEIVERSVTVNGIVTSDSQTISRPILKLSNENCNMGYVEVDALSLSKITLEKVQYTGKIKNIKCEGQYNRNHRTQLTFDLENHDGMFEFHCPNIFTEICIFNSAKASSCNVTTLLALNSTCNYNGQTIDVDCSNLELGMPDPASGNIVGWTGSESINTWVGSVKISIHTWWSITLITIGCVLILILLAWLVKVALTNCNTIMSIRDYSIRRRLTTAKYNKMMIDPQLESLTGAVSYREIKPNDPLRRRNIGYLKN